MVLKEIANAACAAFCGAGVPTPDNEKRQLIQFAAEEAMQAQGAADTKAVSGTLFSLNYQGPASEETLMEAIQAVRLSGEMPYWLTKAAACSLRAKGEADAAKDLRAFVRDRWGLLRAPETVQLIVRHYEGILAGILWEDPRRVEVLKHAYRDGYRYEKECRGCAQCTIAALFDVTGKKEERLFRAANGFASGMGLFGDGPCGGYSGGMLYMGTYAGRRFEYFDGDKEQKDLSMRMAEKLHARFIETYGSVICHDIHRDIFGRAFAIRNPEEKAGFEAAGAHTADKCTAVVATASAWTAEILMEEGFLSY